MDFAYHRCKLSSFCRLCKITKVPYKIIKKINIKRLHLETKILLVYIKFLQMKVVYFKGKNIVLMHSEFHIFYSFHNSSKELYCLFGPSHVFLKNLVDVTRGSYHFTGIRGIKILNRPSFYGQPYSKRRGKEMERVLSGDNELRPELRAKKNV